MKVRIPVLLIAALAAISFADGGGSSAGLKRASGATTAVKSTAAETGLVGVKLYDPGVKIIQLFGEPDEIQTIGGSGSGVAAGGRGGAPGGVPTRGGASGASPGNAGSPEMGLNPNATANMSRELSFGDAFLNGTLNFQDDDRDDRRGGFTPPQGGPQGGGRGGIAPGEGGGPPASAGGNAMRGGAGGGSAVGGGADGRILYTRWVYRMGPSRYGFIFDKSNRLVQVEAIGSSDRKVYTNRGIRFGSTFGDLIKRYGAPDAYEINGSNLVVRYLVRNKVAFRLNQLDPKKPYTVTGIVVAAGKQ